MSRELIVPVYAVGLLGAFLQISGGIWDVSSHILQIPETFFTASHLVLYAGVGLALLASYYGFVLGRTVFRNGTPDRALLTGLKVSLAGGLVQLIAGPFDLWWHQTYGFDPHLFTPSHSLLITGIVLAGLGMTTGSVRLVQAGRSNQNVGRFNLASRWVQLLAMASFATLWLDLNGLIYLITDVEGMNYTFHLGDAWVTLVSPAAFAAAVILLAGAGTLVFLSAKRTFEWTGALTIIVMIGAAVVAVANLGFRAWVTSSRIDMVGGAGELRIASFIPLYLLFIIPVVGFDFLVKNSSGSVRTLIGSALLGPFVSWLDGFYSVVLWMRTPELIPWLFAPMLVAGFFAGISRIRFTELILAKKPLLMPKHLSTPS